MTKTEQIRKRLEAATPAPWFVKETAVTVTIKKKRDNIVSMPKKCGWKMREQTNKDADFIAHAPEDIAYLLQQVEKLKEALEFFTKNYESILEDGSGFPAGLCDFTSVFIRLDDAYNVARKTLEEMK